MIRRNRNLLGSLLFIVLVVGQGLVIVALLQQNTGDAVTIIGWISGAVLPAFITIINLVQNNSLSFFLLSYRLKSYIVDSPMNMSVSANYSGNFVTSIELDHLTNNIIANYYPDSRNKILKLHEGSYQLTIHGKPNIELFSTSLDYSNVPNNSAHNLNLSIRNYRITYRAVESVFEKEISTLFEYVRNQLPQVDTRYKVVIEFDNSNNPFYGMYVSKLSPSTISYFQVTIDIKESDIQGRVMVTKDSLEITSSSLQSLRKLSLEFLSFSSTLLGRFNGK